MSVSRDKAEELIAEKMHLLKQGDQAQVDMFEIILHSLDELNERIKKPEQRDRPIRSD